MTLDNSKFIVKNNLLIDKTINRPKKDKKFNQKLAEFKRNQENEK